MSNPWGTHQYRRESPSPGGGVIDARFETNGANDPVNVTDPSGMLTITRPSQAKFLITLPDRWALIFPDARYLESAPAGTVARVRKVVEGSDPLGNQFTVELVDGAGALIADQTGKLVQLRVSLYNQKGRAS